MVEIPATTQNQALSKAVNRRISADADMVAAKAAIWKFGGFSLLALGIGGAIGLAFWGYARTLDVTLATERIADAIAVGLQRVTLTVKVDDRSTVRLDSTNASVSIEPNAKVGVNGTVRLDSTNATVSMDPNTKVGVTGMVSLDPAAKVRIDGGVNFNVPQPRPDQLGPKEDLSGRVVHTNFTVFKEVRYGAGSVVTGYNYKNGNELFPTNQYCYFMTDEMEGASVRVNLAYNNIYAPPKSPPQSLDTRDAASNCTWFDGQATRQ